MCLKMSLIIAFWYLSFKSLSNTITAAISKNESPYEISNPQENIQILVSFGLLQIEARI